MNNANLIQPGWGGSQRSFKKASTKGWPFVRMRPDTSHLFSSSESATESIGALLAPVFARDNAMDAIGDETLKIAIIGDVGSGKTRFTNGLINANDDFVREGRSDYSGVFGKSATFGCLERVDVSSLIPEDCNLFFSGTDENISAQLQVIFDRNNMVICEHGNIGREWSHAVLGVSAITTEAREIGLLLDRRLAQTQAFAEFKVEAKARGFIR